MSTRLGKICHEAGRVTTAGTTQSTSTAFRFSWAVGSRRPCSQVERGVDTCLVAATVLSRASSTPAGLRRRAGPYTRPRNCAVADIAAPALNALLPSGKLVSTLITCQVAWRIGLRKTRLSIGRGMAKWRPKWIK